MKKLLLTMLGVVGMLCSTSCSDEEIVSGVEGETMVQFTVELTDGSDASRAISDGQTVDRVYYEVYSSANGEPVSLGNLKGDKQLEPGTTETEGRKFATINLSLVKGQTYDVVFWAQSGDAYNTANLSAITIPETTANNESKDAFTAVKEVTVTGPIKETIILKRPFAQVNFATLDIEEAKKAGVDFFNTSSAVLGEDKKLASRITVSHAANTYNALTKEASVAEGTSASQIFAWAEVKEMEDKEVETEETLQTLSIGGKDYNYIATAYVLVEGTGEQASGVTDLKMEIETGLNEIITLNVPTAPVQRNFRTNVLGNLLTNTADFTVEVSPIYDGDFNPSDMLKKVLTEGGEFTLFSDIVLNESITVPAGVEANINLNECTLTVNSSNKVEGALAFSNGNIMIDVEGEEELETAFSVRNGSTISLDDVNVTVSETSAAISVPNSQVEATVNISNTTMTIDGGAHGVSAAQGAKNLVINVEESTLTGTYAFYLMNTNSLVTIDDKSLVKDFWVCGGGSHVTVVYEGEKPEVKTDGTAVTIIYYTKDEYAVKDAFKNGGNVTLASDVTLTEALTLAEGVVANIDLGGNTLTVNEGAVVEGELNISNGNVVVDMPGRDTAFEAVGANAEVGLEDVVMTVKGNNNAITIESEMSNPEAQAIINIDNTKINVEGNYGHAVFVTHFVKYLEINVTNNSEVRGNQAIFIEKAENAVVTIDETSFVEKVVALYGNVKIVCPSDKKPAVEGGANFTFYNTEEYVFAEVFENGGELTLESDATLSQSMTVATGKETKINLAGNTFSVQSSNVVNGTLNINGGDVDVNIPATGGMEMAFMADNGSVVEFENANVTVAKGNTAVAIFNEQYQYSTIRSKVNLKNTTLDATNGYGIYAPFGAEYVEINVENTTIIGSKGIHLANVKEAVITVDATSSIANIVIDGSTVATIKYAGAKPNVSGNLENVTFVEL